MKQYIYKYKEIKFQSTCIQDTHKSTGNFHLLCMTEKKIANFQQKYC